MLSSKLPPSLGFWIAGDFFARVNCVVCDDPITAHGRIDPNDLQRAFCFVCWIDAEKLIRSLNVMEDAHLAGGTPKCVQIACHDSRIWKED